MKKKFRYQEDWEIIYIESFGRGAKVKKVEQEDLEKLSSIQIEFLTNNGFVLIYNYPTGTGFF